MKISTIILDYNDTKDTKDNRKVMKEHSRALLIFQLNGAHDLPVMKAKPTPR